MLVARAGKFLRRSWGTVLRRCVDKEHTEGLVERSTKERHFLSRTFNRRQSSPRSPGLPYSAQYIGRDITI
jgi:hypothetical protein